MSKKKSKKQHQRKIQKPAKEYQPFKEDQIKAPLKNEDRGWSSEYPPIYNTEYYYIYNDGYSTDNECRAYTTVK